MNTKIINIDNTEIILHDYEKGKGKIIVANPYGYNYSHYWGAMGEEKIMQFIYTCNSHYFIDKLLGARKCDVFDAKKTFRNVRKFIKDEIMDFYKHMEFQKEMRQILNDYQDWCDGFEDGHYFVDGWSYYLLDKLPYSLIDCKIDRESIKDQFESITEPWDFIDTKPSDEWYFLNKLFNKLKKVIKKEYLQRDGIVFHSLKS